MLKNVLASAVVKGDMGPIPGLGRSPGGGNGSPLSVLAWRIPWMEESGGLQSVESQKSHTEHADIPTP